MNTVNTNCLITLLAFIIFIIPSEVLSQETPDELDKKFTPPIGSPFEKATGSKNSESKNYSSDFPIKNTLLFEPTWLFKGLFGATYSREITTTGLIATVGIGIPFGKDLWMSERITNSNQIFRSYQDKELTAAELWSNSTINSIKISTTFSISYFNKYNEMEGKGYELGFRRQGFDLSLDYEGQIYPSGIIFNHIMNMNTYYILRKKQWTRSGRRPLVHALGYGVAVQTVVNDTFKYINTSGPDDITQIDERKTSSPYIFFMLSYSPGVGW